MRRSADEAFGMGLVGDIENGLPFRDELGSLAVVNGGRRQQLQSGMMVLVVVPGEKLLAETPCILDRTEAIRVAERTQDLFLDIVGRITGPRQARRYGALLLTSAHGITGLDLSGHMDLDKWHTNAEELVDTLISVLPKAK